MSIIRPDQLYSAIGPAVVGPMPLLLMLDGWVEASDTMAKVTETIKAQAQLTPLVEFDLDELLDHRARRPLITVVDGVPGKLSWPELLLSVGTDNNGAPFLALHGPEPDFRWKPFSRAVSTIVQGIGVSRAVIVGAYPAPAPHTRPVRVSTTGRAEDVGHRPHTRGEAQVAAGVHFAICEELDADGTSTVGLWAQVPYYLATTGWPQAASGLLANLSQLVDLEFDSASLDTEAPAAIEAADAMMSHNPALQSIVDDLETRFDAMIQVEQGEFPTGDELELEVQQYLRNVDGE